jgi:hypothetical protein
VVLGLVLMMNVNVHNPLDQDRLAAGAGRLARRLLPGRSEGDGCEYVHVDVRVRRYGEALPAIRPVPVARLKVGPLPVGTLLDCYV